MDDKKICFVSCVNDDELYQEALRYIKALHTPEGIQVETVCVKDAQSMAAGYNQAMKSSDARYKVYLHQDVFIINKNFIHDIIAIFTAHPEVGLIGAAGAATIPTSGVWWESIHKYGKVYESHTGKMELLAFQEVVEDYQSVKAIDGLVMITRYDIPWREDIFTGWHFYDVSQSLEFNRAGYQVAVPKQDKPWFIHDGGLVDTKEQYQKYRQIFLDEYSKCLFPLVSIMLTSYNRPGYFKIALDSAINQVYSNTEIVVVDNSTNNEVQELIQPYLKENLHIKYHKNEVSVEVIDLFQQCLELADGEYVCFLMDDDIYHKNKLNEMMNYFLEYEGISLVTSYRQVIDENGNYLEAVSATTKIFETTTILEGNILAELLLNTLRNMIGETTTPLFRKKDLEGGKFGLFRGRQYKVIADAATWFGLLLGGKAVYIPEALSYFRLHGSQDQKRLKSLLTGLEEWIPLIDGAKEIGLIKNEDDYRKSLGLWLTRSIKAVKLINLSLKCGRIEKEDCTSIFNCYEYVLQWLLGINTGTAQNKNLPAKNKETVYGNEIRDFNDDYTNNEDRNSSLHVLPKSVYTSNEPLVSVLILAYNRPHYLKLALESVLAQTYKNIEIIIGDDSTNNEVEKMIQPYLEKYPNIRYYNNGGPLGGKGMENLKKCYRLSSGEFINFLWDDDMFHKDKIKEMVSYFMQCEDVSLVTSYRQLIDENGNELEPIPATRKLYEKTSIVDGKVLIRQVLIDVLNYIGEPSTVLFRKSDMGSAFGVFHGKQYIALIDVAAWMHLLSKGRGVYISKPLSYFRIHKGQNQNDPSSMSDGIRSWFDIIKAAFEDGLLEDINAYDQILDRWLTGHIGYASLLGQAENPETDAAGVYSCFSNVIKHLMHQKN